MIFHEFPYQPALSPYKLLFGTSLTTLLLQTLVTGHAVEYFVVHQDSVIVIASGTHGSTEEQAGPVFLRIVEAVVPGKPCL